MTDEMIPHPLKGTARERWEASAAEYVASGMLPRVHFVLSFDPRGAQYVGAHTGPYVDETRAVEIAEAEASIDGATTYVISMFVDGITEVHPT